MRASMEIQGSFSLCWSISVCIWKLMISSPAEAKPQWPPAFLEPLSTPLFWVTRGSCCTCLQLLLFREMGFPFSGPLFPVGRGQAVFRLGAWSRVCVFWEESCKLPGQSWGTPVWHKLEGWYSGLEISPSLLILKPAAHPQACPCGQPDIDLLAGLRFSWSTHPLASRSCEFQVSGRERDPSGLLSES